MSDDLFNIYASVVDRDLGATMGMTQMPYMGSGFAAPMYNTNYLGGVTMQGPLKADRFDLEAYEKREKRGMKVLGWSALALGAILTGGKMLSMMKEIKALKKLVP